MKITLPLLFRPSSRQPYFQSPSEPKVIDLVALDLLNFFSSLLISAPSSWSRPSAGERSFYVADPFGNGLCFVAEETIFTGF
jgi:hypothetical protein